MKHGEQEPPRPPLRPADPSRAGEPESVGALTARLISEARASVEADRRGAAGRGALTRALLALTLLAVTAAAATAVYGAYHFPDAPIRPGASGYVGKTGAPHTREDYERFLRWSLAMWTAFPAAFILGATFVYSDARDRRRRRR
jgi:hypothetical protein